MQEPKYNREYERQILGALLSDSTCQTSRELLDTFSPDYFYIGSHRTIFATIKKMADEKQESNPITVDAELSKKGYDCGGFVYLVDLQREFISKSAIPGYVKELSACKIARELQSLSFNITDMVNQSVEPDEIITDIDAKIKSMSVNANGRDLLHIKHASGGWLDDLERRELSSDGILGVRTGFEQLDYALGGLDEEGLIVIGAAPSMGKTLFCQALTVNIGVDQKKSTMFFSLEMSERQLYERFVSNLSNLPPKKLKSARFTKEEAGRISQAVHELDESGIFYTDEAGLSLAQIRSKVRNYKNKNPDLKLIVIDYLGLIKLGKADRHDLAVGDVTRGLKELAKEIKCTIVLIAQANRTTTRPNMRSLKDSSCIEADADVILFVHRQEILEPETELKGITELIIAKDRHNDGNGTIYMEKVNGGFKELSVEQAGMMVAREEMRLNPPKEDRKRGFKN